MASSWIKQQLSPMMTSSHANAPNKLRVTVSTLTSNMWREDYNSSQVLKLKIVMKHLLNINGFNYVAIHVTNQMQSGAPSGLSSSWSFELKCVCSISVYGNRQQKNFCTFFFNSIFFFVTPQTGKIGKAGMGHIMKLFPGIVCVILTWMMNSSLSVISRYFDNSCYPKN